MTLLSHLTLDVRVVTSRNAEINPNETLKVSHANVSLRFTQMAQFVEPTMRIAATLIGAPTPEYPPVHKLFCGFRGGWWTTPYKISLGELADSDRCQGMEVNYKKTINSIFCLK